MSKIERTQEQIDSVKGFVLSHGVLTMMLDTDDCKTSEEVLKVLEDCISDINVAYWFGCVKPELAEYGVGVLMMKLYEWCVQVYCDVLDFDEAKQTIKDGIKEYIENCHRENSNLM